MIKLGRSQGWLKSPISSLPTWASFHGVTFNGIRIGTLPGYEERGSSVIAERPLVGGHEQEPLMTIPKDLILCRETIETHAKSDIRLRELLDALGDFGRTPRGSILTFLLLQASISNPQIPSSTAGVLNPLTKYISFLPLAPLPTTWSTPALALLTGTSLAPAIRAKLASLLREFELLRTTTASIPWCEKYWWDEEDGFLTFDDWVCLDAMYRSRALEFPKLGDCMVPCVDMANHASGERTVAVYEVDGEGRAILVVREGMEVKEGEEVTITYGDEKGACENIFSYGFLEDTVQSARAMFLDLHIPTDDPLRPAKIAVNTSAPGFRLFDQDGHITWESDFVWLMVLNEEDGLDFKLKQTIDGEREIEAFWKDHELSGTEKLREYLASDDMWEVYQLRAVVLLQLRVESQLEVLRGFGSPERDSTVEEGHWNLAARLRTLEGDMLQGAYSEFEDQKSKLFQTDVVQRYLGLGGEGVGGEDEEVDFS